MKDINVVVVVVISVVSLLTDQFCWLDHGVGGTLGAAKPFERYRRPDQRGRGPPPSIQLRRGGMLILDYLQNLLVTSMSTIN